MDRGTNLFSQTEMNFASTESNYTCLPSPLHSKFKVDFDGAQIHGKENECLYSLINE